MKNFRCSGVPCREDRAWAWAWVGENLMRPNKNGDFTRQLCGYYCSVDVEFGQGKARQGMPQPIYDPCILLFSSTIGKCKWAIDQDKKNIATSPDETTLLWLVEPKRPSVRRPRMLNQRSSECRSDKLSYHAE